MIKNRMPIPLLILLGSLLSCAPEITPELLQQNLAAFQRSWEEGQKALGGHWQVWEDKMDKYDAGVPLDVLKEDWDRISARFDQRSSAHQKLIDLSLPGEAFENHIKRLVRYNDTMAQAFPGNQESFHLALEGADYESAHYLIKITYIQANDALSDFLASAKKYMEEIQEQLAK